MGLINTYQAITGAKHGKYEPNRGLLGAKLVKLGLNWVPLCAKKLNYD